MSEIDLRQSSLPIIVGLRGDVNLTDAETRKVALLFEDEIGSLRKRYPNSRIVFAVGADDGLFDAARTAAEAQAVAVVDWRPAARENTEDESAIAESLAHRREHESRSASAPSVGRLLALTCHVLLDVSRAPDQRRTAQLPVDEPIDLDPAGGGQLIRMILKGERGSEPCTVSRTASPPTRLAKAASQDRPSDTLQKIDRFNRDGARAAKMLARAISRSAEHLAFSPIAELDPRSKGLRDVFALADTLALTYQKKVQRVFWLMFAAASAAAVCYGFFFIFGYSDFVLAPYLLLLLGAYIIFYVSKKGKIHERYVDYRALAEGFRVQFFWSACGIQESAADYYLRKEHGDLDWIRQGIRSMAPAYGSRQDSGRVGSIEPRAVLEFWISNQKRYFGRTLAQAKRAEKKARFTVRVLFVVGVCATAAILFQSRLDVRDPYLKVLSFMSFLCPAIAAGIVGFANKAGLLYQAKHYSRMLTIYSRAEAKLAPSSATPARLVAIALGEEALRENGEWALFRRESAIDEPTSPFKKPWPTH